MYWYPYAAPIPLELVWTGGLGAADVLAAAGLVLAAALGGLVMTVPDSRSVRVRATPAGIDGGKVIRKAAA